MDNLTFEEALHQLEETVNKLEIGELTLDQSLALYEKGQKLAALCSKKLQEANLKVEQLSADGEIVELNV